MSTGAKLKRRAHTRAPAARPASPGARASRSAPPARVAESPRPQAPPRRRAAADSPTRRRHTGHGETAVSLDQRDLQRLVGYNLRRADIHMHQLFRQNLAGLQVRPVEYSVMSLIRANPQATQAAIAEALSIKRPNLVGIVVRLERRGLLRREVDAKDRRHHMLSLSAKGRALLARVEESLSEMDRRETACWSDRERAQLVRLLVRFYSAG
jgi:DNA-binding MarR family transcriptional regulator